MDPAATLTEARRRAHLTQAALAARAGTSQATISAYERGRKTPSVATLSRLLAAAGQQLTTRPAPRQPTADELARVERGLLDVLALAAALPNQHAPALPYPPLHTLMP